MIHPLLKVLISRPDLIADHVAGYGHLMAAQAGAAAAQMRTRALLAIAAGVGVALGLGLAGVALLVLAAVPLHEMPFPWLLAAVPGVPLVAGAICGVLMTRQPPGLSLDALRAQLAADAALLREASAR